MRRQQHRPVVITDAEPSQDDQLRMRQVRYLIMMSIRAILLIVAAVLVSLRVPLLPLWLVLCVSAMVLLPWLAVILANDRPPREQYRLSRRFHHRARVDETPPNAIAALREPTVIDADGSDATGSGVTGSDERNSARSTGGAPADQPDGGGAQARRSAERLGGGSTGQPR